MEGDKHLTNVVCTTNESRKEDVMAYRKLFSACAAATVTVGGFAVVVPPAFGESGPIVVAANPDIVIRRISYADLNLASASAVVTLHRRVGGAVRSLCSEATGDDFGSYVKFQNRVCRTSAWGQAHPQIAQAVERARDIAPISTSPSAAAAITIKLSK